MIFNVNLTVAGRPMVCVSHCFIHQLEVNRSRRCDFVSRYSKTGLFAVHDSFLQCLHLWALLSTEFQEYEDVLVPFCHSLCVHAVWKQDQYFLWPPLSLVVPSHGEFMPVFGCFFFFFIFV